MGYSQLDSENTGKEQGIRKEVYEWGPCCNEAIMFFISEKITSLKMK